MKHDPEEVILYTDDLIHQDLYGNERFWLQLLPAELIDQAERELRENVKIRNKLLTPEQVKYVTEYTTSFYVKQRFTAWLKNSWNERAFKERLEEIQAPGIHRVSTLNRIQSALINYLMHMLEDNLPEILMRKRGDE